MALRAALGADLVRHGLVVGNPVARGVSRELLGEVDAAARHWLDGSDLYETTRPGEAIDVVAEAIGTASERGAQLSAVVAVGGDGTAREVAEGIARGLGCWPDGRTGRTAPSMFIVPAGAGNSAYDALWGGGTWTERLRGALPCGPRRLHRLDLMRVVELDQASLLGVNAGLGARVAELLRDLPDTSEEVRWAKIGEALQQLEPYPGRVTVDGRTIYEGPVTQVTVGGVRRFMRGVLELLPRSVLDDGLLDVCVIGQLDERTTGELVGLMPAGRHIGHPSIVYAQGRRARLDRTDGEPLAIEHDGDPQPARTATITVDVVPGAVPVWGTIWAH